MATSGRFYWNFSSGLLPRILMLCLSTLSFASLISIVQLLLVLSCSSIVIHLLKLPVAFHIQDIISWCMILISHFFSDIEFLAMSHMCFKQNFRVED